MDDRMTVYQLRLDECEVALDKVFAAADPRARLLVPFEGTRKGRRWSSRRCSSRRWCSTRRTRWEHRMTGRSGGRAEVLVHPGRLRWKEARPTRPGDGFVLQVRQWPRRCSDCRRTPAETEFRAYKAAYCVECSRRRQAVIDRRRRNAVAA